MQNTVPTREQIVDAIRATLARVLGKELPAVGEDTRLFDDLSLDSTSVLEVLMDLEDSLGVQIDADTLEQHHFETVGTLAGYVQEQASA